jgi:hypothetical protein
MYRSFSHPPFDNSRHPSSPISLLSTYHSAYSGPGTAAAASEPWRAPCTLGRPPHSRLHREVLTEVELEEAPPAGLGQQQATPGADAVAT